MTWLCRLAAACAGGWGPRLSQPRGNAERSGQGSTQACTGLVRHGPSAAWRSGAESTTLRIQPPESPAPSTSNLLWSSALCTILPPAVSRMWQSVSFVPLEFLRLLFFGESGLLENEPTALFFLFIVCVDFLRLFFCQILSERAPQPSPTPSHRGDTQAHSRDAELRVSRESVWGCGWGAVCSLLGPTVCLADAREARDTHRPTLHAHIYRLFIA